MWFLWFCLSVLLIIVGFYLIYLRGRLLQQTWDSVSSALKQKRCKTESLRKLSEEDINSVSVEYNHEASIEVRDVGKIQEFKNILKQAKIRKIEYKNIHKLAKLIVRVGDDVITYDILVLFSEDKDLFLELVHEYPKYVISLPGLKTWLDENILSKQK